MVKTYKSTKQKLEKQVLKCIDTNPLTVLEISHKIKRSVAYSRQILNGLQKKGEVRGIYLDGEKLKHYLAINQIDNNSILPDDFLSYLKDYSDIPNDGFGCFVGMLGCQVKRLIEAVLRKESSPQIGVLFSNMVNEIINYRNQEGKKNDR